MHHFIISYDKETIVKEKILNEDKDFRLDVVVFLKEKKATNINWLVETTISFSSNIKSDTPFAEWKALLTPWFQERNVRFCLGRLGHFVPSMEPLLGGDMDEGRQEKFAELIKG